METKLSKRASKWKCVVEETIKPFSFNKVLKALECETKGIK